MGGLLRRFILAGISLVCLTCVGCLYVPYCLPEIHSVGEVRVPWPSDDVHVFRVDGKKKSWVGGGIGDGADGHDESHEFERLQPSDRKMIAAQWKISLGSGSLAVLYPVVWCHENTKHTLALRYYRRGYETITVKPGDEQKDLEWKVVPNLVGQEKAVDDLIDMHESIHSLLGYNANTTAAPGTTSPAHREALLFCAAEYDRISWFVTPKEPDADELRSRLEKKSKQLKDLAAGTS